MTLPHVAPETLPIPASHLDLLRRPICGVLTTMGPRGAPESSLVWVDHDGACARANTTLERPKGRNMRANPRVSLLVVDPANTARFIQIRGEAELVARHAHEHLDELTRTYTAHPGKLETLHQRFREHTNRLFQKHGMELVGYWTPVEGEEAKDTLIYVLAYPDRAARDKAWDAFRTDADWIVAKEQSEKNGPLVKNVESKFLAPTDYSPIK